VQPFQRDRVAPDECREHGHRREDPAPPCDNEPRARGHREVGLAHAVVELDGLLVHAALDRVQVALARAREARLEVDIDQQRHVRSQAAAGDAREVGDYLFSEAAPEALVGQRGICEAIREDDFAFGQGGENHLLYVLRAGGEIEQQRDLIRRVSSWQQQKLFLIKFSQIIKDHRNLLKRVLQANLILKLLDQITCLHREIMMLQNQA